MVKWSVCSEPSLKRLYGESLIGNYKGERVIMHCSDASVFKHRAFYIVTCLRTGEIIVTGRRKSDVYMGMRFWRPGDGERRIAHDPVETDRRRYPWQRDD